MPVLQYSLEHCQTVPTVPTVTLLIVFTACLATIVTFAIATSALKLLLASFVSL